MPLRYEGKQAQHFIDLVEQFKVNSANHIALSNAPSQRQAYTKDESDAFLDRMAQYASLSNNKIYDSVIEGVPVSIFTFVSIINDPLLDDKGMAAFPEGSVGILATHPESNVQSFFYSIGDGKKFFILPQQEKDMVTLAESILKKENAWSIFKSKKGIAPIGTDLPKHITDMYNPSIVIPDALSGAKIPYYQYIASTTFSPQSGGITQYLHEFDRNGGVSHEFPQNKSAKLLLKSETFTSPSETIRTFLNSNTPSALRAETPEVESLIQTIKRYNQEYTDEIYKIVNASNIDLSKQLDLNPTKNLGFSINATLYPQEILDFIKTGKNTETKRYRLDALNKIYTLLYGDLLNAEVALCSNDESRFIQRWLKEITEQKPVVHQERDPSGDFTTVKQESTLELIDSGRDFKDAIVRFAGVNRMSLAEFQRGMAMFGRDGLVVQNGNKQYNDIFRSSAKSSFSEAMLMAKLPPEWLLDEKNDTAPYFFKNDREIISTQQINDIIQRDESAPTIESIKRKVKALHKTIYPYLLNAAKAIDDAQRKNNKVAERHVSQKMSWLSKRKGSVIEQLFSLDDEYKIQATMADYPRLLEQLVTAYTLRTLLTSSLDGIENFVSIGNDNTLEIMENDIEFAIKEKLSQEYENRRYDHDDDDDDDHTDNHYFEGFSDLENNIDFTAPTQGNIEKWLTTDNYSFRETLSLNNRIHAEHSKMIKALNKYSDKNFTWDALLPEPFIYHGQSGNVTAHVIDNRLDLLEEGNMMSHCVFSYLSDCIDGESVILSLRDDNNERIATVELKKDSISEDDELPLFEIAQCFAHRNKEAPASAWEAANALIERLNSRTLTFKPELGIAEKSEDLFLSAQTNPLSEGDLFMSIPYTTDAALLLQDVIARYLPKGKSLDSYFSSMCPSFYDVYLDSTFKDENDLICTLKEKYDLNAAALIQIKEDFKIRGFKALPATMHQLSCLHQEIETIKKTLLESGLTNEQVLTEIINSLPSVQPISSVEFGRARIYTDLPEKLQGSYNIDALKTYLASDGSIHEFLKNRVVTIELKVVPSRDVTPEIPVQNIKNLALKNGYR